MCKPILGQDTHFSNIRFKGDVERAEKVYEGFVPLTAHDVADIVHYMLACPEHVNLSDVTILPKAQGGSRDIYRRG